MNASAPAMLKGLAVVGLSHREAPVALREQLSMSAEMIRAGLDLCFREGELTEALLLSTCNRLELYGVVAEPCADAVPRLSNLIRRMHGLEEARLQDVLYSHSELSTVRHILKVASSLDSMVIGETEILGQ